MIVNITNKVKMCFVWRDDFFFFLSNSLFSAKPSSAHFKNCRRLRWSKGFSWCASYMFIWFYGKIFLQNSQFREGREMSNEMFWTMTSWLTLLATAEIFFVERNGRVRFRVDFYTNNTVLSTRHKFFLLNILFLKFHVVW